MNLNEIDDALGVLKRWICLAIVPDGRFDRHALTYRGLFKAPLGLQSVGLLADGCAKLGVLRERHMKPDGDFWDPPGVEIDRHPAPSLDYFYPYRVSWISIGAHRLGCYDVSRRAGQFVFSLQDDRCGGFAATAGLQRFHICGSAQAVLTALCLGQWQAAIKAGDFLVRAYDAQAGGCFYLTMDSEGNPVRDWPPADTGYCYLETGRRGQSSYVTALAAGVLATLYRIVGDDTYRQHAIDYHRLTLNTHEDAMTNPAVGKLAWASALLYRITGDKTFLQHCCCATRALCKRISADPPLHLHEFYPDPTDQPDPLTFEIAFEYAYWLTEIRKEFDRVVDR